MKPDDLEDDESFMKIVGDLNKQKPGSGDHFLRVTKAELFMLRYADQHSDEEKEWNQIILGDDWLYEIYSSGILYAINMHQLSAIKQVTQNSALNAIKFAIKAAMISGYKAGSNTAPNSITDINESMDDFISTLDFYENDEE
jgi:hypothetical protein